MAGALEANSTIELTFRNFETARIVHDSLKPEELLPKGTRVEVKINLRKNNLSLDINAKDTAALRATINSFLRWVAVARDMTKV
ncbi:hypothetical protein AKJ57_01115 [candidate division MSBL1 archaeon SCGC-AAA259A05]|uniref:KEOPS complex Pcc1-like subunit n=1 Tax=candidate division MSBL1 archaeon SCGC-AAA259A05 TaxID=1698259 RepID=A0A133UBB1_9EURY|nr:hypothetical protein AKJ57_01115 [candidate division MSBL1 archaeon SCGC-AAA259A05]